MKGFLVKERALLIGLLGLYFMYVSYVGFDITTQIEDDKNRSTFLTLGVVGAIIFLYAIFVFFIK